MQIHETDMKHPIITESVDGTLSIEIADGVRVRWRYSSENNLKIYHDRDYDSPFRVDATVVERELPLQ
jgi:hypothetical protein